MDDFAHYRGLLIISGRQGKESGEGADYLAAPAGADARSRSQDGIFTEMV